MRKRNKTIIKADRIEHVDVAKVHNPRTRRNAAGKADILQQGVKAGLLPAGLVTDLQRLEEGRYSDDPKRRENLMSRAIILRSQLIYRNMIEKDPLNEAAQRALESIIVKEVQWQKQHKQNPRTRRNGKADILQQGVKAGLLPAGLVTDLKRLEEGRFPADSARRANLLQRALKLRNDLVYQNLVEENLLGEAVQRALFDVIARQHRQLRSRRNPAEKDSEHPIEVTRHFRGGPPGYLSPWQKAMAIGQQELFDTGIKLAPRAAELRAARVSNPGATKPVYQSGLKQATAGQLPRLARVGLRVGRTPAEIRSDLATTGRFTAEQIRRAIDQATTAERRSNPKKRGRRNPASSWAEQVAESKRNFKRELKKNVAKANKLYALLLEYYASFGPEGAQRGAQIYIEDWLRKGLDGLKGQAFSEGLDYHIEKLEQSLEARRENPPVRQIFETFNGRPATRATSVQAPRRTPARVAQLGRLRLIRTADGRTWRFPGERAPFLAADSRGKLHVVGGQYRANPAGEECGEIEQIEYQTSKPHLGHDSETIYYHQLGEETGERPILEITPEGELQIVGGDYRIEADGIHN